MDYNINLMKELQKLRQQETTVKSKMNVGFRRNLKILKSSSKFKGLNTNLKEIKDKRLLLISTLRNNN